MPQKRGKKYQEAKASINEDQLYEPQEAVALVRKTSTTKFDSSVDAHVRLGIDPRHADQMVRSSVVLPHGTGKVRRIAVFAVGEKAKEAMDAGADVVGGEDLVKKVQEGEIDFEVAIATPDAMGMVGRLGKVLGPRGLMPNPKAGTVTFDVAKAIRDTQAGRIEFRCDQKGIVHAPIGRASFDEDKLRENLATLMDAIVRAKPQAAKGTYVRSVALATTMGPAVKVDPAPAARMAVS